MMIHNQQLFSSIFSATPFIFIIKLRKALHLAEPPSIFLLRAFAPPSQIVVNAKPL